MGYSRPCQGVCDKNRKCSPLVNSRSPEQPRRHSQSWARAFIRRLPQGVARLAIAGIGDAQLVADAGMDMREDSVRPGAVVGVAGCDALAEVAVAAAHRG